MNTSLTISIYSKWLLPLQDTRYLSCQINQTIRSCHGIKNCPSSFPTINVITFCPLATKLNTQTTKIKTMELQFYSNPSRQIRVIHFLLNHLSAFTSKKNRLKQNERTVIHRLDHGNQMQAVSFQPGRFTSDKIHHG